MNHFLSLLLVFMLSVAGFAQPSPGMSVGQADQRYIKISPELINRSAGEQPLAVWEPGPPAQSNGILTGTTSNSASTGYASPIGVVPMAFNAVRIPIRGFRADFPPQRIWIRIRSTDGSGTILAQARAVVSGALQQTSFQWFRLDATVSSTDSLFLEYTSNGRIDRFLLSNASTFSGSVSGTITGGTIGEGASWTFGTTGTLTAGANIYCQLGLLPELPSQTPVDLSLATWRYNASTDTFTGWAGPIGSFTTAADTLMLPVWPNSGTVPFTQSRATIRAGSSTGAILAQSSIIGLTLEPGRPHILTYRLDRRVPAGTSLWVEFTHNAPSGFLMTAADTFASPTARYSTSAAPFGGTTWVNSSTQYSPWVRVIANDVSKVSPSQNAGQSSILSYIDESNAPTFIVPRQFYVVPSFGVNETSFYWRQILFNPTPEASPDDSISLDYSSGGNPTVTQDSGRLYFTGGTASTGNTITWTARRGGRVVGQRTSLLNIVANTSGSGVTRKVLTIGDSISDMALAGDRARWMAELIRLFNGDVMSITQIGVKNASKTDSTATSRTVRGEGRSGWTVNQFATDATSPFVFSSAFNFGTYLSTNSITMASGDWVLFFLGTNDIAAAASDNEARVAAQTAIAQYRTMITSIRSAVSGVRIGICTIPTGSSSQDAFGTSYGAGQNRDQFQRNALIWNQEIARAFDDLGSVALNQYVIYLGAAVDPVSGYPTTSTAINARDSATYNKPSDAVHPDPSGNWQIADAIATFLKAIGSLVTPLRLAW
ncbi:MAG: SGNH/GDSL hydrolase family protein [Caulobacteraceae bacterium]|nr:SGNH/GDSL hydrolase family protein [Caulobacteraceae bacterium]